MDGVAPHALGTGNQLQVLDNDVLFIAVLETQAMAGWYAAVVFFPQQRVHSNPVSRWIAGIGYLALQIAILA